MGAKESTQSTHGDGSCATVASSSMGEMEWNIATHGDGDPCATLAGSSMGGMDSTQLTHGDGDGRGDGDKDDDDVETASLPSFAPTAASQMPGDLDDDDDTKEILEEPEFCTKGSWDIGGEAEAQEVKGSDHVGNYGILTANWGGNWRERALQEHMQRDLKSTPCHILCLQEAEETMLTHLSTVSGEGDADAKEKRRPGSTFVGVRGPEPKSSLMICVRQSVVPGIRLLLFHRTLDGTYRVKGGKSKYAMSRIMIASAKMRYFKLRGGGEDGDAAEEIDEIKICNAHLHFRTAKRDLRSGGQAYRRFWDSLARYLVKFAPRFLCGDFNMALFAVIPELRARGFQINLAAWYSWQNHLEEHVRADSCAIFRLGPCQGIRMCFDASAFGFNSPTLPSNCSMVMETLRDENGKEIQKRPHPVPKFCFLGPRLATDTFQARGSSPQRKIRPLDFYAYLQQELIRGDGDHGTIGQQRNVPFRRGLLPGVLLLVLARGRAF